jgi:hypothetical protein
MSAGEVALLISFGSMVVAATSLGWNVYRDVVRKPKLRISMMVGQIAHSTFRENLRRVVVTITNFGPGKTQAHMLQLRKSSWWRRMLRKESFAILIPSDDPLSGRLPAPLEMGEKVALIFPFTPDLFLLKDFTQIGISDSFGKVYWCQRRDYRRAQQSYEEQSRATPSI